MIQLREFVASYNIEILIGLMAALLVLLVLYLIAEIRISKVKKKYNEFTRGVKGVNVEELLIKTGEELKNIHIDRNHIEQDIENSETMLGGALREVGVVRSKGGHDVGAVVGW